MIFRRKIAISHDRTLDSPRNEGCAQCGQVGFLQQILDGVLIMYFGQCKAEQRVGVLIHPLRQQLVVFGAPRWIKLIGFHERQCSDL